MSIKNVNSCKMPKTVLGACMLAATTTSLITTNNLGPGHLHCFVCGIPILEMMSTHIDFCVVLVLHVTGLMTLPATGHMSRH